MSVSEQILRLADINAAMESLADERDVLRMALGQARNGRDSLEHDGVTVEFRKNPSRRIDEEAVADLPAAIVKRHFTRLDTRKAAFDAAEKAGDIAAAWRADVETTSFGTPKVVVTDNRAEELRPRGVLTLAS